MRKHHKGAKGPTAAKPHIKPTQQEVSRRITNLRKRMVFHPYSEVDQEDELSQDTKLKEAR